MTDTRGDPPDDAVSDDSRDGLVMVLIFIAAVLIVTCAVALVALVGAWWVLGFAFGIHIIMTTVVVITIAAIMDGRTFQPQASPSR